MIDLNYRKTPHETENVNNNSLIVNNPLIFTKEAKRLRNRRSGKRKRLRKSERRLENPGFGCPWQAPYDIYYAEFQDEEDEVIELHWIRVKKVSDTKEREFMQRILTCIEAPWMKPENFLATLYLQSTMSRRLSPLYLKGARWAVMFPAKRLYDKTMRQPIAEITGAWEQPLDKPLLGLMRSTIYVEEIVPGEQVTLDNRRCLPGTEIKGGCISVEK